MSASGDKILVDALDASAFSEAPSETLTVKRVSSYRPGPNGPEYLVHFNECAMAYWLSRLDIKRYSNHAHLWKRIKERGLYLRRQQKRREQEAKQASSNLEDNCLPRCLLCVSHPRSVIYLPCGHIYACLACTKVRLKQSRDCLVCHKTVRRYHKVIVI